MAGKAPLTNKQALALWDDLTAFPNVLSNKELLEIMKHQDVLRKQAGALLLAQNPNQDELEQLLTGWARDLEQKQINQAVKWFLDHPLDSGALERFLTRWRVPIEQADLDAAAERLIAMDPEWESLRRILVYSEVSYPIREKAWEGIGASSMMDEDELLAILKRDAGTVGQDVLRILLRRGFDLRTALQILEHSSISHEKVWPQVAGKCEQQQLLRLWQEIREKGWAYKRMLTEHYNGFKMVPTDPNDRHRPWWQEVSERYKALASLIAQEVMERFPTRKNLQEIFKRAEDPEAHTAAKILLEDNPTNVELRRIIRHKPALRHEAWSKLKAQGLTAPDLEELRRHVPELREELASITPRPAVKKPKKVAKSAPAPPPEEPKPKPKPKVILSERDKLLQKLIGSSS